MLTYNLFLCRLSGDTLQLLGRLRAAKCREDANTMKINPSFAKELRQVINRATNKANNVTGVNKANLSASVTSEIPAIPDVKPTNLLDHLAVCSNDVEQRPYACPICDVRCVLHKILIVLLVERVWYGSLGESTRLACRYYCLFNCQRLHYSSFFINECKLKTLSKNKNKFN